MSVPGEELAPPGTLLPDALDAAVPRSLLANAGIVAALTILVKAMGGVRDLIMARRLGASGLADAYLLALAMPTVIVNLLVGAIPLVLVPAFANARRTGGPRAVERLSASVTKPLVGVLAAATAILMLLAGPLMRTLGENLSPNNLATGVSATRVLSPLVLTAGIGLAATSLLHECRRFALAATLPIISSIAAIAVLVVVDRDRIVHNLAVAVMVGLGVEALVLVLAARRLGFRLAGNSIDRALTRSLANKVVPLVGASLAMAGIAFVDLAVAARVTSGGVAEFTYGTRVITVLMAVVAGTVGTVFLPHFSMLAAADDFGGLREEVRRHAPRLAIASAAIAVACALLSRPITDLFLRDSAVNAGSMTTIAWVQAMATLQLPFYVLIILFGRVLSAIGANFDWLRGTALSFAVNLVGDVALSVPFGVPGIAVSTTLSTVFVAGWLAWRVHCRLGSLTTPLGTIA